MVKLLSVVSLLSVSLIYVNSAPMEYMPVQVVPLGAFPPQNFPMSTGPKFVWNFVGDLIQNSGFLPLEINVPDTVASIASGAQTVAQGLATGLGGLLQRIPIVTRWTSPESPRPLRLVMVDQNGKIVGMVNK